MAIFGKEKTDTKRVVSTPRGKVQAIAAPLARETYVPLAKTAPGVAYRSGATGSVPVVRAPNARQSFVS